MRASLTALAVLLAAAVAGAQPVAPRNEAPGFLGVAISEPARMDDMTAQQCFGARTAEQFLQAWRLRAEDRGALVLTVLPGQAADQFGIIPGDLIVAVNAVQVENGDQFQRRVGALRPGTEVVLSLLRAGREKKIAARLGRRPAEYPFIFQGMPEETPKAAPPEGLPPLVTPEEAAKALGGDFTPPPASDPGYDAAVKLYREGRVAAAEGLLLAGPIALGAGDAAVARAGDEIVKLGGAPVAAPMGFAFEILKHKFAGDFPLTLDVRSAEGAQEGSRTLAIVNPRDADRAAAARFFTDEDRIFLWLLDLSPSDAAPNLDEQKSLARLQPRPLLECVVAARALRLPKLAEDAAAFLLAAYPESKEAAALTAHDLPIQLAAWDAQLRAAAAAGDIRLAVETARAILGKDPQGRYGQEARRFMDCVNAAAAVRIARAEKLLDSGDLPGARQETAPVARAIPEDPRFARLLARCDDLDTLQTGRRALDEGQLRRARLMAEAVLARNPKGAAAKSAQQLLDAVRSTAKKRTDRANRLLDAGDADSAREELAPVLQAFPDDPAAIAAWRRAQPPVKNQ